MRSIARHITFFLILFFAFNVGEISSSEKHAEEGCECCTLSDTNILETREDECTSCCCVMQRENDMYFSEVSSLTEVDFPLLVIGNIEKNNSNGAVDSLKHHPIPFHFTKTSFPFLQVILA